jgi:hypothetical protein
MPQFAQVNIGRRGLWDKKMGGGMLQIKEDVATSFTYTQFVSRPDFLWAVLIFTVIYRGKCRQSTIQTVYKDISLFYKILNVMHDLGIIQQSPLLTVAIKIIKQSYAPSSYRHL